MDYAHFSEKMGGYSPPPPAPLLLTPVALYGFVNMHIATYTVGPKKAIYNNPRLLAIALWWVLFGVQQLL